jgi:DNA-binding IclR family transcriptional regulator
MSALPADPPSDLIQSLQRGLRVLEFVAAAGRPVTPREVAAGVGLNVGTTYHLVNTLLYEGYLRRGEGRSLVLGRPVGPTPAPPPRPAPLALRRALGRAAHATGEMALMTVLAEGDALVTAVEEAPGARTSGFYVAGSRHAPDRSAAGRVMLARDREAPVGPALAAELARVRRAGVAYAVTRGEACVGVPVVDPSGRTAGAIALVVTPEMLRRGLPALTETARRTSACVSRALWPGAAPAGL